NQQSGRVGCGTVACTRVTQGKTRQRRMGPPSADQGRPQCGRVEGTRRADEQGHHHRGASLLSGPQRGRTDAARTRVIASRRHVPLARSPLGVHASTITPTQPARSSMDCYYHSKDLGKFGDMGKGNPVLWEKFMSYYSAVFTEGALTEREKALIALGVAHAVQCPYCIDAYTQ